MSDRSTPPVRRKMSRRRGYTYADHGTVDTGGGGGNKLLLPGASVDLVWPDFYHVDGMIFRPLPAMTDPEETGEKPQRLPYRFSPDPYQFSDFMRTYAMVRFAGLGKGKVSFFLHDPMLIKAGEQDPDENPFIILKRVVYREVKAFEDEQPSAADQSWFKFVKGQQKALGKWPDVTLMQGLLFKRGKESYFTADSPPKGSQEEDNTQVFCLANTAGSKVIAKMNAVNENFVGDWESASYEETMLYGDILDLAKGRFIRIIGTGDADNKQGGESRKSSGGGWGSGGSRGSRRNSEESESSFGKGYDAEIDEVLHINGQPDPDGLTAKIDKAAWPTIRSKIQIWDDILYLPSYEEQAVYLAKAFRVASKVLEFAWQDHAEYLTKEVRSILANAKQAQVDGLRDNPGEGSSPAASRSGGGRPSASAAAVYDEADDMYADDYTESPADADDYEAGAPPAATTEEWNEDDYDDEGDAVATPQSEEAEPEAEYEEYGEEDDVQADVSDDYPDELPAAVPAPGDKAEDSEPEDIADDEAAMVSAFDEYDDPDQRAALEAARARSEKRTAKKKAPKAATKKGPPKKRS